MGRKKVTDEEILLAYANPNLKDVKDILEELSISRPGLWMRKNKIENFDERLQEITKAATNISATEGFKEMHRIITSDSRQISAKDKISALRLVLQYRGELIDNKKIEIPEGIHITISEADNTRD